MPQFTTIAKMALYELFPFYSRIKCTRNLAVVMVILLVFYAVLKSTSQTTDFKRVAHSTSRLKILNKSVLNDTIPGNRERYTNRPPTRALLRKLKPCDAVSPNLVGQTAVNLTVPESWKTLEDDLAYVEKGGRWRPKHCSSRHQVAIVVPYRNRQKHLMVFLRHIHKFLQRQLIDYGVYVVDQIDNCEFNRAMLLNIGFLEARKIFRYECYIFHDVDLLPENDKNSYYCSKPKKPKHISVALDIHDYKLFYSGAFGGVTAFHESDILALNGYSNMYFGWGSEDDDMLARVRTHGMSLVRPSEKIARYTMQKHVHARKSPIRVKLYKYGMKRSDKDGLNSIKYHLTNIEYRPLFTLIQVQLNKTEVYDVPYTLFPQPVQLKSYTKTVFKINTTRSVKRSTLK